MLTQLRKVQRFLHTYAETIDKSHDHNWQEITWGRDIKTLRYDDLLVSRVHQTTFGLRSIRYEEAVLWNHLPKSIKSSGTLKTFKKEIKSWTGPQCKCAYCKFVNDTDPYITN